MPRDANVYLADILEAIERIRGYTRGLDYEGFLDDPKTFDAVLHNLQVLGEAAKHVPQELRAKAPEIEWRNIAGMRDMISHAYFSVDPEIVWEVVSNRLEELAATVTRLRV